MKYTVIIDENCEEEIIIRLRKNAPIAQRIIEICNESSADIVGYDNNGIVILQASDVYCFTLEDGKLYALTDKKRYLLKQRLYEIENIIDDNFLKINQSCLINVGFIERFDASIGASLTVTLKNGHKDYVSRRQLKKVKERIGFKL